MIHQGIVGSSQSILSAASLNWYRCINFLRMVVSVWDGLWTIDNSCLPFNLSILKSKKVILFFFSSIVNVIYEWIVFMNFWSVNFVSRQVDKPLKRKCLSAVFSISFINISASNGLSGFPIIRPLFDCVTCVVKLKLVMIWSNTMMKHIFRVIPVLKFTLEFRY